MKYSKFHAMKRSSWYSGLVSVEEKHSRICRYRRSGRKPKDIGREFGISGQRVYQIWEKQKYRNRDAAEILLWRALRLLKELGGHAA